jgi:serine/threonine-protein kinase
MSQVHYHPLGPLLAGEGSRAYLGLALEGGVPPRPVVLVWAPPEVARNPELSAELQRETQRAVVLDHPNILRVHGLVSLEAGLARVTEFADGESLRRLLEVRSRIPPAFAALIASDVATGLHYAHLAGNEDGTTLVHGDLRPETVMVSFNGVCKVTGYGALGVAPRERNGRRVRNRRNYSAPEQLLSGREALTARTDVFLLGLLLHECLSGRMPFQDSLEGDQAILARQLTPLPSDIPPPLAEVVRRATAPHAQERYATALEFRQAVVAAIGVLPSAPTFAEFLTSLFPPDRDARATRRQTLEMGLAEVARRASPTGMAAVQPARPSGGTPSVAPPRPSGTVAPVLAPPIASIDAEVEEDIELDAALQEEDADAIDSVMELTGRHTRPGVARPLPRENTTPPFREKPPEPLNREGEEEGVEAVEEVGEAPAPSPKRRSRVLLLLGVGAMAAAAALGGFFLWNGRPQSSSPPSNMAVASSVQAAPTSPAVATPPAVAQATPPAGAPAAPVTAQEDGGTTVAGTAGVVVLAGGSAPSMPGGSVVPASGQVEVPTAEQAAVSTRLLLFVVPPVDVSLEGKRLGRTPLEVPLAPGPYLLELSNPAKGVRATRSITVQPQGMTTQRILLGKGTVQVRAPAGSRIFLNGHKAGPKLSLYEGEHQLVVTTGKARWEKSFRLEAHQKVTFDVAHEKP